MSTDLRWYGDQIGRVPLLTPAQEITLGTAIRAWLDHPDGPDDAPPAVRRRGKRAKDRFVEANLRLSYNFVLRHCQHMLQHHDPADVISQANIGLIRGVERFDPMRGYKFSTFGYWWIRQAVQRWSESERIIRVPGLHVQHVNRINAAREHLATQHARDPTLAELAEATGLKPQRIEDLLREAKAVLSLDHQYGDLQLGDTIAAPCVDHDDDLAEQARSYLARLPPHLREVLALRFGIGCAQLESAEIAHRLGLSVREVRQLERCALQCLRQPQQQPRQPEADGSSRAAPERFDGRLGEQLRLIDDGISGGHLDAELPQQVDGHTEVRVSRAVGSAQGSDLQLSDAGEGGAEGFVLGPPLPGKGRSLGPRRRQRHSVNGSDVPLQLQLGGQTEVSS